MSLLFRSALLMLVLFYTFAAADLVKRTTQFPECQVCQEEEEGCGFDETLAEKMKQNKFWPFGTQYYSTTDDDKSNEAALTVGFVTDASLRGPPPYVAISSLLEEEVLISVHYVNNLATENGKPSKLMKKAVYKVKSKEQCRGPMPEHSSPNTIADVFYHECSSKSD